MCASGVGGSELCVRETCGSDTCVSETWLAPAAWAAGLGGGPFAVPKNAPRLSGNSVFWDTVRPKDGETLLVDEHEHGGNYHREHPYAEDADGKTSGRAKEWMPSGLS